MDWMSISRTVTENLKKHRYILVVLLIGVFLMMLPQKNEEKEAVIPAPQQMQKSLQSELEALLSQMEGAGKVSVLLTESAGERKVFQTNDSKDQSEMTGSIRTETVILSGSGRGEEGLVKQTLAPQYLGAVVLCQGADSAAIRLAIIEAVSSATGLASHNITVLKMK